MVGQLAKAHGLRTVAIAGGAEKCKMAKEVYGFDEAIDHRAHNDASSLRKALSDAAPDGIDIYFENVGGKVLEAVIPLMNTFGRIPVCGMVAWYGGVEEASDRLPMLWRSVLVKRMSVTGFIIADHWDRFGDFQKDVAPRVDERRDRLARGHRRRARERPADVHRDAEGRQYRQADHEGDLIPMGAAFGPRLRSRSCRRG